MIVLGRKCSVRLAAGWFMDTMILKPFHLERRIVT